MEYTYLNWPSVAFLALFLILAIIEKTRYTFIVNSTQKKIICYNFYRWFDKEVNFIDIKKVIFYPNYLVFKINDGKLCLYFKKKNRQELRNLFFKENIRVIEENSNQNFNQFFDSK